MTSLAQASTRLVPLSSLDSGFLMQRLDAVGGQSSQLRYMLDDEWQIHRGELVIDGDLEVDRNLVVDGNLTVLGRIDDHGYRGHLVVLGDVCCTHLLNRQLFVTTGSLHCRGLVYADCNDFELEVWGPAFTARALIVRDKATKLPDKTAVEYFFELGRSESEATPASRLLEPWAVDYMDEDDCALTAEEVSSGSAVACIIPAEFNVIRDGMRAGRKLFVDEAGAERLSLNP